MRLLITVVIEFIISLNINKHLGYLHAYIMFAPSDFPLNNSRALLAISLSAKRTIATPLEGPLDSRCNFSISLHSTFFCLELRN